MRNCDYVKGMKVKVPVQDALAGLAGHHPLPPLLRYAELVWGERGGGVLASLVLPGNSERGRGVTLASLFGRLGWHLIWADENRDFFPRDKRAGQFGDSRGQVNLASSFSGLIWQVHSAG
jgi:hypothetical protein